MKQILKRNQKSIITTLCLLAIGGAIIFMSIKLCITHWSSIVQTLSDSAASVAVISFLLLLITGFTVRRKLAPDEKKKGKIIMRLSLIVFFLNTFALFNKLELLNMWLIILGGITFLVIIYITFQSVKRDDTKNLPMFLMLFFLVGFMYYWDLIIFSWDKPWLSSLTAIFIIIKYINSQFPAKVKKRI